MQETKNTSYAPLIAGILFAFVALLQLIQLFVYIKYVAPLFLVTSLIHIGAYAVLAFALVAKRRNILLPVGFALLALLNLSSLKYNFFTSFISLLCNLVMAFFAVVFATDYLPQFRDRLKKLWFLPPALIALASILSTLNSYRIGLAVPALRSLLITAATIAGTFLASAWMAYPDIFAKQTPTVSANSENSSAPVRSEAYCGLVKHILLLLFTCGIWLLIWIYRMTAYTNGVEGEEDRDPTKKLLLCMFVPFYQIFWTYKTAQRIDKLATSRGVASDLSTLCLILEIFVPFIPPILMQDKMNAIVTSPVGAAAASRNVSTENQPNAATDVAEELKKFKELLDSGVITQEEFDAKKRQLLGL